MEEIPPPYDETGILNFQISHSWAYDITRENQLLPVNSEFPSEKVLLQSMLLPFLMSGHHVEMTAMCAPNGHHQERFYCPKVMDATHGTCVVQMWPVPIYLYCGQVNQRLLCKCSFSCPTEQDSSFFSAFIPKYETPQLALASVAKRILWITLNPPIENLHDETSIDNLHLLYKGCLIYHSTGNYGPKQKVQLTLVKGTDGGYTVQNPIEFTSRDQRKHCAVCQYAYTTHDDNPRLIFGLSCRHHICEKCNLYFWGMNRTGRIAAAPSHPPRCPTCRVILEATLSTPIKGLSILRAPFPLYHYGMKPVYTVPCLDATQYLFTHHIQWYLEAVVLLRENMRIVTTYRRAAYTRVHVRATLPNLPTQVRNAMFRSVALADDCLDEWQIVQTFLDSKLPFVDWCYSWGLPFPRQLLDKNIQYYVNVMERDHYLHLYHSANSSHLALLQVPMARRPRPGN
jgi:hypothetical protein